VPFTVSHAAAALPFRRSQLIPSALVMGTVAPDLEYFVRFAPGGGWGHTIPGALGLSLPLALASLWLFHNYVKLPATLLLPERLQRRLEPWLHPFAFGGPRRFALIVGSIVVGIATHLAWDSFTHDDSWLFWHWEFLRRSQKYPLIGWEQNCGILQYSSSLVGFILLVIWLAHWYRTTRPAPSPVVRQLEPAHKIAIFGLMAITSVVAGVVRAWFHMRFLPPYWESFVTYTGIASVTAISLLWWQLILWGLALRPRFPHAEAGSSSEAFESGTSDAA
jgi:hypothetical protein